MYGMRSILIFVMIEVLYSIYAICSNNVPVLVIDHHLVLDKASDSQVYRSMSNIFMVNLHTSL